MTTDMVTGAEYVTGRAILCQKPGGTDVLQLVSDYRVPVPKTKGELLVKLASTGVNRCECATRSGQMPFKASSYPCVMGSDGAGVVVAAGEGSKFKEGDKVVFLTDNTFARKDRVGATYAEFCVVSEANAAALTPEAERALPLCDAGGLPVAALSAHKALGKLLGNLPAAEQPSTSGSDSTRPTKQQLRRRVLIFGASGGVGQFAVQLAKLRGLYVVGVCSARNARLVTSLGADEAFDYAEGIEGLQKRFGGEDGKGKFEGILDLLGGELPRFALRKLLKRGGAYSVLMGGGVSIPYVALRVVLGALRLGPRTSLSVLIPKGCGVQLEEIVELFAAGKLRMAEVAGRFGPEEAGKAHELVGGKQPGGKVLINW